MKTPTPTQPAVTGNERKRLIAEVVMLHFNLTADSFDALPRGLASELYAMVNSHDALVAACKAALVVLTADSDSEEDNATEINQLRKALDTINA